MEDTTKIETGKKFAKKITSKMADAMHNEVRNLEDTQLRSIIKLAKGFSTTNCGWVEYAIKDTIIALCENAIRHNKFMRKLKKASTGESKPTTQPKQLSQTKTK